MRLYCYRDSCGNLHFIIDKETGWAGGGEKSALEGSHLEA